ncbi:hypothetical protein [Sphingobacterium deserti]|uniref:Uncharacterized protein n=1 Tax=Sphingobacterium deserti TaxID=1229276 RepID=A0A0B8T7E8_9SPHI|nr:hypothetical protein [Sphingobacterium deserti]KGE14384.1 hypothetical protein DI53_1811 [Sphingobacterium deserti]
MTKIFASSMLVLMVNFAFAQKKQRINIDVVQDIVVDANLDEWSGWVDVADEGLWAYQLL